MEGIILQSGGKQRWQSCIEFAISLEANGSGLSASMQSVQPVALQKWNCSS